MDIISSHKSQFRQTMAKLKANVLMESFTLGWAAEKLGANLPESAADTIVRGICTDTRNDVQDTLFFALQGETSDGHQYIRKAFEKGAVAAIVSEAQDNIEGVQIVVPNTLKALGDLAHAYRMQFAIPVVGITGSVGKTSTKEMTAAVLRTKYNVLANEKNYNNEIGVPLTLFRLEKTHEVAVIEMGMRGLGEIDRLAEIAAPTIGVITNIGYAHIERLGSQEKIAEAKSELLARLPANGTAILPREDKFLPKLKKRVAEGAAITYFPLRDTEISEPFILKIPAVGTHHIKNAHAAIKVGMSLSIPFADCVHALENWHGAEGRMVKICLPTEIVVLDDCYNAGVESMTAALQTLNQTAQGRKVAVIGDMKELGTFEWMAHEIVGREILKNRVDMLITVGYLARLCGVEATRPKDSPVRWKPADTTEEAAECMREIIQPGDTVLVKGSRSMHMEKIVEAITGQESTNAHA